MTSIFPVTLNYALHREYLGSGRFSFWASRLPWLRGWTIPSNNTEMNFPFPPIGKTSTLTAKCSAKSLEKVLKYSANVDESHDKKGKHKEFLFFKKKTPFRNPSLSLLPKQQISAQNQPYFQKKTSGKNVRKRAQPTGAIRAPFIHFQPHRGIFASEREVHHSWASSIRSVELQGPQPVARSFDSF